MPDDILDAAQKVIDDAAKRDGTPVTSPLPPEPAPPTPTPPSSQPPSEEATKLVESLLEPKNPAPAPEPPKPPLPPSKKKVSGVVIALILLVFGGLVAAGSYFVSQRQQIADTRSSARGTEPCKVCSAKGKCVSSGVPARECSPEFNECSRDTQCGGGAPPPANDTPPPGGGGGDDNQCIGNGKCVGPGQDCCSGGYFDATCGVTEMRCGTSSTSCSDPKPVKCGNKCVDTRTDNNNCGNCGNKCPSGSYCSGYSCVKDSDCGRDNDSNAPICCSATVKKNCQNKTCEGGNRLECVMAGGAHCTIDVGGCKDGGGDDTGDNDDDNVTPPKCQNIKIYKGNQEVTPSTLKPGDDVKLAVKGNRVGQKGRFRVNGAAWTETTTKNGKNEWTLNYTIPSGVTDFVIEGEVFIGGAWR